MQPYFTGFIKTTQHIKTAEEIEILANNLSIENGNTGSDTVPVLACSNVSRWQEVTGTGCNDLQHRSHSTKHSDLSLSRNGAD